MPDISRQYPDKVIFDFNVYCLTNYFRGPQIQMQTEAELSLEEIKEREEAIRKLEVQTHLIMGLSPKRGTS